MNTLKSSLLIASSSLLFISCSKEPEPTVKTFYGTEAPMSQAQEIGGVWVLNDNAEKYKSEVVAKAKEKFPTYVKIAYVNWCYMKRSENPTGEEIDLKIYEIAQKHPMNKEFFEKQMKSRKGWNPIMLDMFDDLDHSQVVEKLKH